MALFSGRYRFGKDANWIKRHSLSLALVALLVVQLVIVLSTGYGEYVSEQQAHKEAVTLAGYVLWSIYELAVSIIADTYGALLLVLFAKWFYEEGSPETMEPGDEGNN